RRSGHFLGSRHQRGHRHAPRGRQGCGPHRRGRHARHARGVPRQGPIRDVEHLPDPAAGGEQARRRQGRQPSLPAADHDALAVGHLPLRLPRSPRGAVCDPRRADRPPGRGGADGCLVGRSAVVRARSVHVIDFRYHLVSIASVFLALAVGIVLGAGPLKGTISDTLTSEVTKLREDANTLRAELNAAESAVSARDDLIDELRPRSVAGVLAGKRVVIVALPGTSDATIDTARGAVDEAGATVGSALRLQPTWASEEPPDITDRDAAAGELRELLAGELPVGIAPDRVLSLALA